ncbi:MAG: electron transfer flavoprotein subunit alpha/FixB family protein [Salinisphaera sp.]|nr:electron transfer flavoprotein subunit alpha/FixB family protein [Salinisphaera sp.]
MPLRRRARRALQTPVAGRPLRRDPRAEREPGLAAAAHSAATGSAINVGPSGRLRRDPRAVVRQAGRSATGRLRIDRSGRAGTVSHDRGASEHVDAGPELICIEAPAFWIVVVPDYEGGRLSSHDRDVFGAARKLSDGAEGAVVAVVFEAGEDLGAAGADRVLCFDDAAFAGYAPDRRAAAIVAGAAALTPRHLLFPDTAVAGGDIGRRVAAMLADSPAANVHRLRADEAVSRADGDRADYLRAPSRVLLMAAECELPIGADRCCEARRLEPPAIEPSRTTITDRGLLPTNPGSVPLAEADFVISAGNGVTDWTAFHALAEVLGAAEGGSRVVCDAGLLPRERQVGASGTLIQARCYLAFGISGAPQHLQGIVRCEKVVAINTDLHAEMVKRGDLSAIKDAQAVMPALTRLLEVRVGGA